MNEEFAKKWVAKLRDPKIRQITDGLYDGRGYCCLGVAERVAGSAFTRSRDDERWFAVKGTNEVNSLTPATVRAAEMFHDHGMRRDGKPIEIPGADCAYPSLQSANDSGVSFAQIADYIERNWEQL